MEWNPGERRGGGFSGIVVTDVNSVFTTQIFCRGSPRTSLG
jgi:hypothetical protein